MKKIYFVRHQAAGVVHQYPFAELPTQAQVDAVAAICNQQHGATHPKTKEPHWVQVWDVNVIGDEVPDVPVQGGVSIANEAASSKYSMSGTGRVDSP